MWYAFLRLIPRLLNSDAGELPRIRHTIFRTRRKFEIRNTLISNWEMKGDQSQSNKKKGELRNARLAQLYWRFPSVILTQILNS
jgi:hypothetical protein